MTDLGMPAGYVSSYGYGINASDQVVGRAYTSNSNIYHAFLYNSGTMTDLGTLGGNTSTAWDINASGQVVGGADSNSGEHAFLYSSGAMADLNSLVDPASGWTLEWATAVNDSGQIVGCGRINAIGYEHAFLLTPTPEPSTFDLLGIAAVGLLGWAWRRRTA